MTYVLHIMDTVEQDLLSGLQLESIIYACQRHEQFHPDNFRCGFFIGDGTHSLLVYMHLQTSFALYHARARLKQAQPLTTCRTEDRDKWQWCSC